MKIIVAILFAALTGSVLAQATADLSGTKPPPATASIQTAPVAAAGIADKLDAVAATRDFMNRLQGEARAKSDAYAEGGYWLLLWNLLE